MPPTKKELFYAVAVGRTPGVYKTWDECKREVAGVKNAKYKKFDNRKDADEFIKCLGSSILSQFGVIVSDDVRNAISKVREDREDDMPGVDALMAFTDGSAINNGKKNARAGYAVVWPRDETMNFAEAIPSTEMQTNNRAEYSAAHKALLQANEIDPSGLRTLWIYTDSQLVINCVTKWLNKWKKNGWKTATGGNVEHQDLLKDIDVMTHARRVKWVHVRAHTGGNDWKAIWNDKVDQLARSTTM